MIQLHVLIGAAAGRRFEADKFPITVGRSADCSFVLNDAGIFDRHFEIQFSSEGFTLQAFAAEDPDCGKHSIWLATYGANEGQLTAP